MKQKKIYWKDVIKMLKKGKSVSSIAIDFKKEQIPVNEVILLNKNGFRVPEQLILYSDKNIKCSDISEITDKDIVAGKIQWINTDEFPIDNEIRQWISQQNINLSDLMGRLIKNFYQTMKNVQNKAAI